MLSEPKANGARNRNTYINDLDTDTDPEADPDFDIEGEADV